MSTLLTLTTGSLLNDMSKLQFCQFAKGEAFDEILEKILLSLEAELVEVEKGTVFPVAEISDQREVFIPKLDIVRYFLFSLDLDHVHHILDCVAQNNITIGRANGLQICRLQPAGRAARAATSFSPNFIKLAQKKRQIAYRTATTAYPCFLPDLGEFSGSWSYGFAATKLIKKPVKAKSLTRHMRRTRCRLPHFQPLLFYVCAFR
jgi:hypothetical protein